MLEWGKKIVKGDENREGNELLLGKYGGTDEDVDDDIIFLTEVREKLYKEMM